VVYRLIALLALILVACGGTATPSAVPAASVGRPEKDRVKLVYATASGQDTFVELAAQKSMFQTYGLTGEVGYAQSNTSIAALTSGEAQLAMSDAVSAASAIAAGTPLKVIAYFDKYSPYMVVALPENKTFADLKGKTVAISRVGDTSDISLRIAFRDSGLMPGKDFTLLQVGNSPARWAALSSKQVAAAILDEEAFRGPAEKEGMNVLINLHEKKLPYAASALIVTEAYGKDNPNAVVAVLRTLMDATAYMADPKNKDEVMALMSKLLRIPAGDPQLGRTYEAYHARPAPDPYPDRAGVETILAAYKDIDPQRYGSMTPEQVIDSRYMDTIRALKN
jgi:NitT/TauT family transport system substrate-binding protein